MPAAELMDTFLSWALQEWNRNDEKAPRLLSAQGHIVGNVRTVGRHPRSSQHEEKEQSMGS